MKHKRLKLKWWAGTRSSLCKRGLKVAFCVLVAATGLGRATQVLAEPVRIDNPAHGDGGHYHWPPPIGETYWLDITGLPGDQGGLGHTGTNLKQLNASGVATQLANEFDPPVTLARDGFLVLDVPLGTMIQESGFTWERVAFVVHPAIPEDAFPEGVETYLPTRLSDGRFAWVGMVRTGIAVEAFAWGYETEPGVPIAAGAEGDVSSALAAAVDIKPGSCPNPFNRSSHGVLPVALVGTDEIDVSQIDLSSIVLSRADGVGGAVAPNEGPPGPHTVIYDVGTSYDGELCGCHTMAADGIMDLSMKFRTDDLVAALLLDGEASGALVELVVSGNLLDGTLFAGSDCVQFVPPGPSGPNVLAVNSNLAAQWIAMSPSDEQDDTGGFGQFHRTYPLSTRVILDAEENYLGQRFVGWKFNGEFLSRYLTTAVTVSGNNANGKTVEAVFRRAGDITGDEAINLNDFALFAICFGQNWGTNGSSGCSNEALASSDLDRNGVVDLRDFAIFALEFGT